jgi:nondiscriminating glutamyl-tRNA synthetase
MSSVRVRIAPSPTGNFHFGTARSALFNYLFAKKMGGKFILRIEDTDLERSDEKYTADIIEQMKWLGIIWDEGPAIANRKSQIVNREYMGSYGPYFQSQRLKTYEKYIQKLLDEDKAYYCFCTEEQLEKDRQEDKERGVTPVYRGACRGLSNNEVARRHTAGEHSVIRFNYKLQAKSYKLRFRDLIRGDLEFDPALIGDFAIAKDLRTPLYNFAVVVDDYTMDITHVIRGEDHISNTPKQLLLQEALGFPHPQYAHLPLILNPDRSKISKRAGPTSVCEYREQGYLPEAMINFMAFLGWNPKDDREIFSLTELEKEFSLENIGKSGAVFNLEKLNHINGWYIRQKPIEELTKLCVPYLEKAGLSPAGLANRYYTCHSRLKGAVAPPITDIIPVGAGASSKNFLQGVVALARERMEKLSDVAPLSEFFFKDDVVADPKILVWKKSTLKDTSVKLQMAYDFLKLLPEDSFKKDILEKILKELIQEKGIGAGELLWPLRVALTGREASPSPFEVAEVLGKERVLERIAKAIERMNG